ncbi:MAG: 3-keto-5-aminohexanoate cleavage protein, partial [Xanthobacteraceae bacterium]
MITAAPYGPMWMPGDCTPEQRLPVTWEEQTQIAVDCYNAGATVLHIHVRDPKTGHISKNLKEYDEQIARLRKACAKDDPASRRFDLIRTGARRRGEVSE